MFKLSGLILFFGTMSLGFTLNSPTSSNFKGWEKNTIEFQINLANCPAGVDITGIIDQALAIWNNVSTSKVKLSVSGNTTNSTYGDPIPIICDPNYGSGTPGAADGSPGAAVVQPGVGDYITSGIMYLNASSGRANIANYSQTIVAVTLAHEIGHLLGLGHSQDVNALMYYDAGKKSALGLAQDDIDGISYLYPRNELSGDKPLGCGRVESLKPPTTGEKLIYFLLLLMPIGVYGGLKSRLDLNFFHFAKIFFSSFRKFTPQFRGEK